MRFNKLLIALIISLNIIASVTASGLSIENNVEKSTSTKNKKVLVTGFESWRDIYNPNPAELIVRNLSEQYINGVEIIGITTPVIWDKAVEVVTQAIIDYEPDIVISIGTGYMNSIHLEKVGKNLKSCIMPDNEGKVILLRRIDPYGPFLHFSTLPIENIEEEINKAGIPVDKSYRAGRFICNEVLYGTLNFIDKNDLCIKAGFIHVPLLPTQDEENGMELDIMIDAVRITIIVCLN